MNIQLSQSERKLLQDHMKHEEVCIEKYQQYAQQSSDPELRSMFSQFASQERQHYDSLNSLLQGRQPSAQSGHSHSGHSSQAQSSYPFQQDQQQQSHSTNWASFNQGSGHQGQGQSDALMCRDAMMTEKFISDSYDNGIFGSSHPVVRQTLQHIQDEEQQHGEGLMNYLQKHGLQG